MLVTKRHPRIKRKTMIDGTRNKFKGAVDIKGISKKKKDEPDKYTKERNDQDKYPRTLPFLFSTQPKAKAEREP